MKKVYTLMALAVSLSAVAAQKPFPQKLNFKEQKVSEIPVMSVSESSQSMKVSAKKAPANPNLNQYEGLYSVAFGDPDFTYSGFQMMQTGTNEVTLYGLGYTLGESAAVKATYDQSTKSLTFKSQLFLSEEFIGGDIDGDGKDDALYFVPVKCTVTNGYFTAMDPIDLVMYYSADGWNTAVDTSGWWTYEGNDIIGYILATNPEDPFNTGFSGNYYVYFTPIDIVINDVPTFEFNDSEWVSIGDATFTDGWLNCFASSSTPAYKVPAYRNATNNNLYLLKNPYGVTSPYAGWNANVNQEGYMVFDTTYRDCVLMRPNTNGGFSWGDDVFAYNWGYGNCVFYSSASATHYIQGIDVEKIIKDANKWGDELGTVTDDGLITIPDPCVQILDDFINENGSLWIDWAKTAQTGYQEYFYYENRPAQIQLPSFESVDGVTVDNSNAPKRYFNLQGVEIANPAAGELVIIKQGNSAKKVIL